MTLTDMFTICDSCVYAPCICGNDPENCVAYVMRTSFTPYPRQCGPNRSAGAPAVRTLRAGPNHHGGAETAEHADWEIHNGT